VNEFCSCGARLPEDARFCHKCGQPQFEQDVVREEPAIEPLPQINIAQMAAAIPQDVSFHNVLAVRIAFLMALVSSVLI